MLYLRKALMLSLASLWAMDAMAEFVPESRAYEIATSFLGNSSRGNVSLRLASDGRDIVNASRSDQPTFYYYTGTDGYGFVIVAADDAVNPILGYSFDSPTSAELPVQMVDWFTQMDAEIKAVRAEGAEAVQPTSGWESRSRAGNDVVIYQTALWDQDGFFRTQCPGVTGCVQTAEAILMRYLCWPPKGEGVVGDYTYGENKYISERDISNHYYDWESLPLTGTWTSEQKEAIATIMADLGYANHAEYGPKETLATVSANPLVEHFNMSRSLRRKYRGEMPASEWIVLVKAELDEAPIVYDGRNSKSGHAFVLDGYTDDDYFHVNWGWGGSENGYFKLTNLVAGGGNYSGDPSFLQYMRRPDANGDFPVDWITLSILSINNNWPNYPSNFTAYFYNNSVADFKGHIKMTVKGRNGLPKHEFEPIETSFEYNSEALRWSCPADFFDQVDFGDYYAFYYRGEGQANWHEVMCAKRTYVLDEFSIEDATSIAYDSTTKSFSVKTKDGVTISLLRDGFEIINICATSLNIPTTELEPGTYALVLTKRNERKEIKINIKE